MVDSHHSKLQFKKLNMEKCLENKHQLPTAASLSVSYSFKYNSKNLFFGCIFRWPGATTIYHKQLKRINNSYFPFPNSGGFPSTRARSYV